MTASKACHFSLGRNRERGIPPLFADEAAGRPAWSYAPSVVANGSQGMTRKFH